MKIPFFSDFHVNWRQKKKKTNKKKKNKDDRVK